MLEARPEIHRDRAQLKLDAHRDRALGQKDRHLKDQMQAAVAVRLGTADRILDIVLFLDERQIALPHEHVRYGINILNERTDHADAADVVQVVHHGLKRHRKAAALELAHDAARRFDAALDGVDGARLARNARLVCQNVQFGLDLTNAGLIQHHNLLKLHRRLDQCLFIMFGKSVDRKKIRQIHVISSCSLSLSSV